MVFEKEGKEQLDEWGWVWYLKQRNYTYCPRASITSRSDKHDVVAALTQIHALSQVSCTADILHVISQWKSATL